MKKAPHKEDTVAIGKFINELATNRDALIKKIESHEVGIREELGAIVFFDDPRNLDHHINKIHSAFGSFSGKVFKGNKRLPTYEQYLVLLFAEHFYDGDDKTVRPAAIAGLQNAVYGGAKYSGAKKIKRNLRVVSLALKRFYSAVCLDLSVDLYTKDRLVRHLDEMIRAL